MSDKDRLEQAAAASRAASEPLQQAGTHPLGTAAGALGGATAGAIAGIAAGPVGSLAGAVGGAVAGGILGSGAVGAAPVAGPVVEQREPSVQVETTRCDPAGGHHEHGVAASGALIGKTSPRRSRRRIRRSENLE